MLAVGEGILLAETHPFVVETQDRRIREILVDPIKQNPLVIIIMR